MDSGSASSVEGSPKLRVDEDAIKDDLAPATTEENVKNEDITKNGVGKAASSIEVSVSANPVKENEKNSNGDLKPIETTALPVASDSKILCTKITSTPLGSPLTPDNTETGPDRDRDGSLSREESAPKPKNLDTPTTSGKRKSIDYPGSPQTVVSERRQLALLRQQALSAEAQSSDMNRDRPSTPSGSSTSSTKESREARSVNRRDGKGETPLHLACKKGDLVAMKKLIDDGADINSADNAGWTPLHEAANRGREEAVKLLLKNRADTAARGMDGMTPLMDAILNGHVEVVKILIKAGADPKATDDKGQTCLQMTEKNEAIRTLLVLETASAEDVQSKIVEESSENPASVERSEIAGGSVSTKVEKPEVAVPSSLSITPPGIPQQIPNDGQNLSMSNKPPVQSQYEDISDDEDDSAHRQLTISSVSSSGNKKTATPTTPDAAATTPAPASSTPFHQANLFSEFALNSEAILRRSIQSAQPTSIGAVVSTVSPKTPPTVVPVPDTSKTLEVVALSGVAESSTVRNDVSVVSLPSPIANEIPQSLSVSQDTPTKDSMTEETTVQVTKPASPSSEQLKPTLQATSLQSSVISATSPILTKDKLTEITAVCAHSSVMSSPTSSLSTTHQPARIVAAQQPVIPKPQLPKMPPALLVPVSSTASPTSQPTRIPLSLEKKLKTGPCKSPERINLTLKRPAVKDTTEKPENTSTDMKESGEASLSGSPVKSVPETSTVEETNGPGTAEPRPPGTVRKQRRETIPKPMTRQRAQALAAPSGPVKRRNARGDKEKPVRGARAKRALAEAEKSAVEKDDPMAEDPKQKRARAQLLKKIKTGKEELQISPQKSGGAGETSNQDVRLETSSIRLPFKKRLTIRNEIEEFVTQRRQVEENWKRYTNNFPMRIFPRNFNDCLIMRKSYNLEASLSKRLDIPPGVPTELRSFFVEQENERHELMRQQTIERDRLIMGAEQEMMRLHQRFCRLSAGITIPLSACMIVSEQESNRSFQNQDQEEQARTMRNRISVRDLIKWLEESDRKHDMAKKEMLTRHRLEATMLRSKQRMDWAWKMDDLNMIDPSCRNPEDLDNLYIPQVIVEDFVIISDHMPGTR